VFARIINRKSTGFNELIAARITRNYRCSIHINTVVLLILMINALDVPRKVAN